MSKNAENQRVRDILAAGAKCPTFANYLAFNTQITAAEASKMIAAHLSDAPQVRASHREGWTRAVQHAGKEPVSRHKDGWSKAVNHALRA